MPRQAAQLLKGSRLQVDIALKLFAELRYTADQSHQSEVEPPTALGKMKQRMAVGQMQHEVLSLATATK